MSMDPVKEKRRLKRFKSTAIGTAIGMTYAGLMLGAEWVYRGGVFADFISNILKDLITPRSVFGEIKLPGCLILFPTSPIWILLMGLVAFFIILSEYINYVIQKNTRPGEEQGSASFNDNYDKVLHDYVMSPKMLCKYREEKLWEILWKQGKR